MDSVLDYIYSTLGLDVDFCLPFAALSENGRGLSDLDSKSELAHRIMLTNVLRLVGKIKKWKDRLQIPKPKDIRSLPKVASMQRGVCFDRDANPKS